jgi:hypothetical protein
MVFVRGFCRVSKTSFEEFPINESFWEAIMKDTILFIYFVAMIAFTVRDAAVFTNEYLGHDWVGILGFAVGVLILLELTGQGPLAKDWQRDKKFEDIKKALEEWRRK